MVVVSAGGFDTHANQLPQQAGLLEDLATGIDAFFVAIEAAGLGDDVLLVVTSEFGRRAAENGSVDATTVPAGCPGRRQRCPRWRFGEVDLGDLLDGDIRPSVARRRSSPGASIGSVSMLIRYSARDDSLALLH